MALAGFEPTNLGTKGQHATPRPPKPSIYIYIFIYLFKFLKTCSKISENLVAFMEISHYDN